MSQKDIQNGTMLGKKVSKYFIRYCSSICRVIEKSTVANLDNSVQWTIFLHHKHNFVHETFFVG